MRTKECRPLAKAISGITNTDERRIVKAAVIRLLQSDNPLFDPDVFGKAIEDYRKQKKAPRKRSAKDRFWKGINLLREGRDILLKRATDEQDRDILLSVDDIDRHILYLVRHVWANYK